MKNVLLKLLLVVTAMAISLFAISCTNPSTSESLESTSESLSESIEESVVKPEVPIVGAGENGEINLGEALDLLSPILSSEYVTINFAMDSSLTTNSVKFASQVKVVANVKRTLSGYDVIATFTEMQEAQSQSYPVAKMNIYYVDGLAVYGMTDYSLETPEIDWYKFEAGTFNELINTLNEMIASNEEAVEIYKDVMKAVEKLEIILSEQDLVNVNSSMNFNLAEYVNQALGFILANKDVDMYSFLLKNVAGIDVAKEEEVEEFESFIVELCTYNPTLAVVLDEAVEMLNDTLMEEARQEAEANNVEFNESEVFQLDLETLFNFVQEQIGVSTTEIISLIKTEIPSLSDLLTDPEEGETLYDYLYARLAIITIDDLAKMITGDDNATAVSLLTSVKLALKDVTLGAVINNALNSVLNGNVSSDGDASTGEVGDVEDVDYLAMVEQLKVSLQSLVVGYSFKTDAYGRPTELGGSSRVQVSYLDVESNLPNTMITATVEESTKLTLSYAKIYMDFEIPQEVLDLAQDAN
ncbi:MAG: hypothetical protein IKA99_00405 [Clostridia bacterium]|nr:hypothetical protein [Clostridia bacterium]